MALPWTLNPDEARVLGALLEKQSTTPEYYPLSLNALAAACNQRSSREPVMNLSEDEVRLALRNLQEKRLASPAAAGRVPKFEHQLQEALNLTSGQTALLCVLLLRGAQTAGELRGRSERMHPFAELDDVTRVLQQMIEHDPPLVAMLPRQPGTKESRYAQLLTGEPAEGLAPLSSGTLLPCPGGVEQRLERLEQEVAELRAALFELRGQLAPPDSSGG